MYYCLPIQFGTPEFDNSVSLRYDVLRKPLGLQFEIEDIEKEWNSNHIACYDKNAIMVGILVLKHLDDNTLKMRQVAVDPNQQKNGIGQFMVNFSENWARDNGYKRIELHARIEAVPFYEKLRYIKQGNIFKEVNIDHLFMFKDV